jgi:hypothetical protein
MRDRKIALQVEECLHLLDLGEDLLDILNNYPDRQDHIKSILLVAMASRAFPVPNPSHTSHRLGKNQMLEKMEILRVQGKFRKKPDMPVKAQVIGYLSRAFQSRRYTRLALSYRLAMVALVFFASGGFLTVTASASSQPGDMLYPLRKSMVQVSHIISQAMDISLFSDVAQPMELDTEAGSGMGLNSQTPRKRAGIKKDIWSQLALVEDEGADVDPVEDDGVDEDPVEDEVTASPRSYRQKGSDNGNKFGQGSGQQSDSPLASSENGNRGKSLGLDKDNSGKAMGKDKEQGGKPDSKPDKGKGKDKDKDNGKDNGKGNGKGNNN